jgi:chromosome segregation ATPase
MSQQTFASRIGKWFKGGNRIVDRELPLESNAAEGDVLSTTALRTNTPRSSFLRPWAKRDEAINNLQHGVGALGDLMNSIRDNLEAQGRRQQELLQHLSHLPKALEALPEAGRMQGETLKAIHQQLATQNGQQSKLGDILERIVQADNERRQSVDDLRDSVENLRDQDSAISDNLGNVGIAMQHVSRASEASTKVLEQMRENISSRDGELQAMLNKQNSRFTLLLSVAIGLSILALAAVAVAGYFGYRALMNAQGT